MWCCQRVAAWCQARESGAAAAEVLAYVRAVSPEGGRDLLPGLVAFTETWLARVRSAPWGPPPLVESSTAALRPDMPTLRPNSSAHICLSSQLGT